MIYIGGEVVVCHDLDKGHYILKHTTLGLNLFHIFTPKCSSNGYECSTKCDPLAKKGGKTDLELLNLDLPKKSGGQRKARKKSVSKLKKK